MQNENLRIPDQLNPILGWRGWHLFREESENKTLEVSNFPSHPYEKILLLSLFKKVFWDPKEPLQAKCIIKTRTGEFIGHECPHSHCSCGVYAFKADLMSLNCWPTALFNPGDYFPDAIADSPEDACGIVKMWGRIIEHEIGYRSEFAYPLSVIVRPDLSYLAPSLARTYPDVAVSVYPKEKWDQRIPVPTNKPFSEQQLQNYLNQYFGFSHL